MTTKLTIENLKNIKHLEFEVPKPGAFLLTGNNGSGKTSLLVCLSRLRNNSAFQRGFRSSAHQSLDSHRGASVKYEIGGDSVTYTYVEERWAPLPRRNSGLLAQCGYPEVTYIAADGDRVEPKKDEFSPRSVRPTEESLRNDLNEIFGTARFSDLCYINLTNGGKKTGPT
jgi:energy-coupling factor transporter ATP-binding protein EcfA2